MVELYVHVEFYYIPVPWIWRLYSEIWRDSTDVVGSKLISDKVKPRV
jgi:hypothetical protein